MSDADSAPDRPRRATRGSTGRRPKFALPADHHEELESDRTTEHIEAFLDGPAPTRRTRRRHDRSGGVLRTRGIIALEDAGTWDRALRHEDARIARYGRPATVLIVDATRNGDHATNGTNGTNGVHGPAGTDGTTAPLDVAALSTAIREQARETDHVTRVGPARFHVLLPETDEREATILAERMARAGREALAQDVVGSGAASGATSPGTSDPTNVRVAIASPSGGGTLADALRIAGQRLED